MGVVLGTLMLSIAAPAQPEFPAQGAGCHVKLRVHLSPEVLKPRDPGFLSSLTSAPGYLLTWIGASRADMAVNLELSGPGPGYLCREEIERIRRDARVLDVKVLSTSSIGATGSRVATYGQHIRQVAISTYS